MNWRIGTPAPSSLGDMVDPEGGPPRCPFKERHAAPAAWRFVADWPLNPLGIDPLQRAASLEVMPLHGTAHTAAGGQKSGHVGSNVGPILVSDLLWVGSAEAVVRPAWLNFSLCAFLLPFCGIIKKRDLVFVPSSECKKVF